jgi:hypothetical protein
MDPADGSHPAQDVELIMANGTEGSGEAASLSPKTTDGPNTGADQ